ncbi:MAG TPA: hypothetical protein VHZ74_08860 [Bryobacteraceae bacterium]|jgi:hypothetical protein|nr:hypothetical protein [Bryobacteraceae bacterium]
MLKIGSVRWRGKCPRHPRFDPYMDGPGVIRGGCEKCTALADIYSYHVRMIALMRTFAPPQKSKRSTAKTEDLQASLFGDT